MKQLAGLNMAHRFGADLGLYLSAPVGDGHRSYVCIVHATSSHVSCRCASSGLQLLFLGGGLPA